jgi:hypothetical protein
MKGLVKLILIVSAIILLLIPDSGIGETIFSGFQWVITWLILIVAFLHSKR